MSITLYGSLPSPYVRRTRMLLEGSDFQFEPVNVYDDQSRQAYAAITPIRKLPLLVDGEQQVFDSHVIQNYLCEKLSLPKPTLAQQNLISAIDAVTDSLIILFMGQKSELPTGSEQLMFKMQLERIPDCLGWLEQQAEQGAFADWHYATMALVSLLDWGEFRELYDFSPYASLRAARDSHSQRQIVIATAPE